MSAAPVCPACGSSTSKVYRASSDRVRCGTCGTVRFTTLPSAETLDTAYRTAWQQNQSHAIGATDGQLASQLLSITGQDVEGRRLLDWGAGSGALAMAAHSQGADTTAFEPFGSPPLDCPFVWISEAQSLRGPFDMIFMIEVIEHSMDPLADLAFAASLLRDDGRLVITTPNARGLNALLRAGRWREVQNPVHINLFTPRGLRDLAERAGFTRIERDHSPVDFGHRGLRRVVSRALLATRLDGSLRFRLQA